MDRFSFFHESYQRFFQLFKTLHSKFTDGDSNLSITHQFPFDTHPGPLNQTIVDAIHQHKSVFVYVFTNDRSLEVQSVTLFENQTVIQSIRNSYLFLPLLVTSSEGFRVANFFSYTKLPVIAIIRPDGNSIEDSRIYAQYEGNIDESTLLSTISIERMNNRNNQGNPLINEQNLEYQRAEVEETQRVDREREEERRRAQEEAERIEMEKNVHIDFENLPVPRENEIPITVKFQFPNGSFKTRQFPQDSPLSYLFIFVRKFLYPNQFSLVTGFPSIVLQDSSQLISEVVQSRQFVVLIDQ